MPRRIYLHLGPPKTGTTYLQSVLEQNMTSLRDQGILVAGTQVQHHHVADELMGTTSPRGSQIPSGAVHRMQRRVAGFSGDVVLSSERYSLLRAPQARRFRDTFADREQHVVFTLRDPAAVLPSIWQEGVKNGSSTSWPDFCAEAAENQLFMARQIRARRPLRTWSQVLPSDRIHIVTVPGSGKPRTLLLERICRVLRVEPGQLLTQEPSRANPSIDLVGTELIRRINARPDCQLPVHAQRSEIKAFLARRVLAQRELVHRAALTEPAFDAARAESRKMAAKVRTGGHPIIGDLADLMTVPRPSSANHLLTVDPELLIEAAVESIAALADRSYARAQAATGGTRRPRRTGVLSWLLRVAVENRAGARS